MNRADYAVWLEDAFAIDSEGLRSYARATRAPHVPYAASRVIPRDTAVPPLIVAQPVFKAATALMAAEIEDFNVSRLLHVSQAVRQVVPIRIGDVASLGARITDRVSKAGIDLFQVDCVIAVGDEARIFTSSTVAYAGDADMPVDAIDAASEGVVMHGAVL